MKNILLPTDFSENAWNSISYALELFKAETCTFYLLHTYTPSLYRVDYLIGGPEFSVIRDPKVDESLEGLDYTLVEIELKYPNNKHRFEILSAFNTLTDEVEEVCTDKQINLIVMGTQGATGAKEIFLGTNTVHVIRKAKVPVLVVPVDYTYQAITSVLFPTDYRSRYKKEELQLLMDLVNMLEAELIVLHVKEEYELTAIQEANRQSLRTNFESLHPSFVELKGALMPDAIHEYVREREIDLLAMMNRKHSFLERLLLKQNVDSVGYHTETPFLVIPETAPINLKEKH
ncbi:universal stress protein [Flavobacteriaceae bacterium TP-CH-4]|uniref:Universal stress protein n=1 Tax=Pelagihabitans pacificus TaxID=2696054 RepID=A0A967EDV0_9FLAO|nr:universal stress protein [Pelagihabitans pacificus]NHF59718.1 universal stress protein [Pelagihabitans pacificus]